MTQKNHKTEMNIGDKCPDGSIYAGVSPETGRDLYVTARSENLLMDWKTAMQMASDKTDHNHQDWRLPTFAELKHLYDHRKKLSSVFNICANPHPHSSFVWSQDNAMEMGKFTAHVRRFNHVEGCGWIDASSKASAVFLRG